MSTKQDGSAKDVVVVGGGVGGLSAAMWLGRYRRATLVVDSRDQRNLPSLKSHGYLTRDGVSPQELLELAHRDAIAYESVRVESGEVTSITRAGDDFEVGIGDTNVMAHRIMLATGVSDVHPDIPGFDDLYGRAVFHCSCCDGYEARGREVVAIGWGEHTAGYALDLLEWGARVTLVTNGETFEGDEACTVALERNDIEIVEERVIELQRDGTSMTGARLESGDVVSGTMAFFSIAHRPRASLAQELGCDIDDDGYVEVDEHGRTSVEGVYAVGDVTPGEQLVQVAAAAGAIGGIACAMSLRGIESASHAPVPGPDPDEELEAATETLEN
ncbi:MAG: NAD(P)/FAD-dependent oxidoreductase [Actinomycetota bacterium]|nr:NAD(P)/FAD-dependent oxidoreductase [Actinomycetota bacterium]